ncbi:unnamed protein product [Fraxinus pennsylvanica]|uniref:Replication protein A OB domain-containing protein n=1 Tax=Fraxinus pennsylvanica TaxID=56036 RepID=A0AAD2A745_9LAMI|nr:unnamed protein product [Fraxinus pennsylvanica]
MDTEIAFVGIVVDVRPKRKIPNINVDSTVQALFLLMKVKLQAIVLTIWDNFIDREGAEIADCLMKKPIIVGNHLKVTSFKGISLSTKANSSIFIDPKFEKLVELRKWTERNKEMLTEMIVQKTYDLPNTSTIPLPLNGRVIYIKDLLENTSTRKPFWIRGKYMHARAIPRARCSVSIGDHTGNITASLFGNLAEKFLHLPAEKIMKDNLMPYHIIGDHKSNYSSVWQFADEVRSAAPWIGYMIEDDKTFGSSSSETLWDKGLLTM